MGARDVALALRVPERTVRRWLAVWLAAGVTGIERARVRGPIVTYTVDRSVIRRWKRGALPVPHERALLCAA